MSTTEAETTTTKWKWTSTINQYYATFIGIILVQLLNLFFFNKQFYNLILWTNKFVKHFHRILMIGSLIMCGHGAIIGWASPALQQLTSESTPLASGVPFTNAQVSWIGSINCVGGLIGSVSLGYFITLMGCKRAMLVLTFPVIIFWLLIYFGDSYLHIFAARFIRQGFGLR